MVMIGLVCYWVWKSDLMGNLEILDGKFDLMGGGCGLVWESCKEAGSFAATAIV